MNSLEKYKLNYEKTPLLKIIKRTRKGGKDTKMSKETVNEAPKASKKYAKSRGEHYKDVVIAMLVASIIAFIGGIIFQSKQQSAIETAVNALTPIAQAKK